jgi:hypothetical protein
VIDNRVNKFINIITHNFQSICQDELKELWLGKGIRDISDIKYFHTCNNRSNNDNDNKIREKIIESMPRINNDYFNNSEFGSQWFELKTSFDQKMREICPYSTYEIKRKAGRNYKYDFNVFFFDLEKKLIKTIKLEFKYNAETIDKTPQFVSPMKPSQYLSRCFEEYYYSGYLKPLFEEYKLIVPDLKKYIEQIHGTNPKCLVEAQTLYILSRMFS